jgi:hypothetical protein
MNFNENILRQAHKHSSLHKEEILNSDVCGCFYCIKISKPTDIHDWVDTENPDGPTALCPICGIDALIGSASGFPVDNEDFLKAMNNFWF